MNRIRTTAARPRDANTQDTGGASTRSADWLGLAATPVLAVMALLTATQDGNMTGHGSSPLSSMALMYALMGVFHAAPWGRLLSTRWS